MSKNARHLMFDFNQIHISLLTRLWSKRTHVLLYPYFLKDAFMVNFYFLLTTELKFLVTNNFRWFLFGGNESVKGGTMSLYRSVCILVR